MFIVHCSCWSRRKYAAYGLLAVDMSLMVGYSPCILLVAALVSGTDGTPNVFENLSISLFHIYIDIILENKFLKHL